MPESLTESFCERCGTRYAFKAPTSLNPLRRARGFAAGLKNYVMSSDSLGEALADAMHDETESLADRQVKAFHKTFNFCMTCRQYACRNCWNEAQGRCLTCAPTDAAMPAAREAVWPEHDVAAQARLAELTAAEPRLSRPAGETRPLGADEDLVWPEPAAPRPPEPAWPAAEVARAARPEPQDEQRPTPPAADQPIAAVEATQPVERGEPTEDPAAAEPPAPAEPPVSVPLEVPETVERREPAEVPVARPEAPTGDRVVVAFPHSAAAEAGAEPPAVGVEGPKPAAEPTEPRPAEQEPFPQIPTERIAAALETREAAARRQQLELLGLADPAREPAPSAEPRPAEAPLPVLPTPDDPLRWIPGPAESRDAVWAESTRRVASAAAVAPVGVQDCTHCGLSLSANARFCRRCGQRQLRSA